MRAIAMIKKKKTELSTEQIKDKYQAAENKLKGLLSPLFSREETRVTALAYVRGLLSQVERKNSWQLSEESGYSNPYGFQYLLRRAYWDANILQKEIAAEVYNQLGSNGILAVDETGFIKKGNKSAGVARQYSGTAGRIENSQIGVFLSYMTASGRSLIDRELYLPKEWLANEDRCKEAGIPADTKHKTKPELALQMLQKAFANGIRADWVVGDNVYGCSSIRNYLQEINQQYVLAIPSNQEVAIGFGRYKVNSLLSMVEKWYQISAGSGAKGPRVYLWAMAEINCLDYPGYQTYLLFRKSISNAEEVSYYITFAKDTTSFDEVVTAASSRWSIEECFEVAKSQVGLDQYEVRNYTGWYRHITLSMLAMAFLNRLNVEINLEEEKINNNSDNSFKKTAKNMQEFMNKRGLG
jgi:SRSO17 transposase